MLLVCWKQDPEKPEYVAVTVNILKAIPDSKFVHPEIRFAADSSGCKIRNEDGWTSETPSEFYFTINVPRGNENPPAVLVDMKGVKVRRVIMPGEPDAKYEMAGSSLRIRLVRESGDIRHLWSDWTDQFRTDVQFPWNWTERRDGRYADPEPLYTNRNIAHIAYAIGAREVYRDWDMTNYLEKNFPGKGDAAAVGYENNFPRRHEDYPPHIHIWFKWPDWRGYNTHLYMDDNGEVHSCWVITPSGEKLYPEAGEWQPKKDDEERIVFYVRYTETGSVDMWKSKNDPVYSLKIFPGDVSRMTVLKNNKPFKLIHIASFDPEAAKIVIEVCNLKSKTIRTETLITDRDTAGGKRQISETRYRDKGIAGE